MWQCQRLPDVIQQSFALWIDVSRLGREKLSAHPCRGAASDL
jgi:hypothetical protein